MTLSRLYEELAAASHCAAGCSAKQAVWHSGKVTLYRYQPIARPAAAAPLLIVYALVNRPYMMDLQEDRSLIRGLLAQGLDVYLIDWGYPDGADRFTTLADSPTDTRHGAGMALVRRYVHEAGGKIALASLAGHETRFKIVLPAVADSQAA